MGAAKKKEYLQGQVCAVTQMDTLERAVDFLANDVPESIAARPGAVVCAGQRKDGFVRDVAALDQADALQLGQLGQAHDRIVRQVGAAAEVDVADAVAFLDEPLHGVIRDLAAVTQMQIVQVLTKLGDRIDGGVRDVATFSQHQVAETRGNIDNLSDGGVRHTGARSQIENAQMIVRLVRRERQEGRIVDQLATSQS